MSHFSHLKASDAVYKTDGLRAFFAYRDLGIAAATDGKVVVQLVKAHQMPIEGTGWHIHTADFHVVFMISGWAKFMYEDVETLVAAGDCVHQLPGIKHFLFDYSPDMEFLEIVSPADFPNIAVQGPCPVPSPNAW